MLHFFPIVAIYLIGFAALLSLMASPKASKQAAELCKISSTQARDLLGLLVKKGILEIHGSKKRAYYAEASKNMDESK